MKNTLASDYVNSVLLQWGHKFHQKMVNKTQELIVEHSMSIYDYTHKGYFKFGWICTSFSQFTVQNNTKNEED